MLSKTGDCLIVKPLLATTKWRRHLSCWSLGSKHTLILS